MTAPDSYQVKLALVANCPTCGQPRPVSSAGLCPVCGEALPSDEVQEVRAAVSARRAAFKDALRRLGRRVDTVVDGMTDFAVRGVPLSEQDHLDRVIRPAFTELNGRTATVKQLLESCVWDPRDAGTIAAFGELVRELDAGLGFVVTLRDTMPPVEWRAVHRELVRAAMALARGQVSMAATIAAVDMTAALALSKQGEYWFDEAARHMERISRQITLIGDFPADGPIRRDGSVDVAAAAWTGVGQHVTSIEEAAWMVREAFGDIPGVRTTSDEYVVGLLPIVAMSARAVDYELLVARAKQLREVLDLADATGGWIADPGLLVERVVSGIDRVAAEVERLGREWRHGLPRHHVARTLTEVYRELVEGALIDLGGALLVAARAGRSDPDGVYEAAVVEAIKAGEIVSEFVRLGAPCSDGIDMLYRNASAHASVKVTDTGISATQKEIRGGRVVSSKTESLTDEEFSEELVSLYEMLLALQFALLPWMWAHSGSDMAAAVSAAPISNRQRDQTLALIAGLAGLSDIEVSIDGDHVTITATAPTVSADRIEIKVLSVVPAAFPIAPDATTVTLNLSGLAPVTFARGEFGDLDAGDVLHAGPLLGLVTAKWLLESGGSLDARDEAAYITVPLTDLHTACAALATGAAQPVDGGRASALRSLRLVRTRLDEVLAEDRRSNLTRQAAGQLDILIEFLEGLDPDRHGAVDPDADRQRAERAAGSVQEAHRIAERARAIRDDTNGGS